MSFTNFTSSVAGAAAAFAAFARESERSRFPIGSICEETRFIINEKSDERAVTFHLTTPLTQQHCMASEDTITGRFNQDMTRTSHRHVYILYSLCLTNFGKKTLLTEYLCIYF